MVNRLLDCSSSMKPFRGPQLRSWYGCPIILKRQSLQRRDCCPDWTSVFVLTDSFTQALVVLFLLLSSHVTWFTKWMSSEFEVKLAGLTLNIRDWWFYHDMCNQSFIEASNCYSHRVLVIEINNDSRISINFCPWSNCMPIALLSGRDLPVASLWFDSFPAHEV